MSKVAARSSKSADAFEALREHRPTRRRAAAARNSITKTADSKGRVVLGALFANRAVIVEKLSETEMLVKLARVIPESESWLYENPEALDAVRIGLLQAKTGKVSKGPDIDADARILAELEE